MIQRRLAADVMDCSPKRVRFDPGSLEEIDKAITKDDIRKLLKEGVITILPVKGNSNARLKKRQQQRRRGRRRGTGSRKGPASSRTPPKARWMAGVRAQRDLLFRLRERNKVNHEAFRMLYSKIKGGFFRSTHHIKMYCEEKGLFLK